VGDRVSGLMLRVTTIHASSASASAKYYTRYLSDAPGEEPGQWSCQQAAEFGLSGTVDAESLELLLSGCDPVSGTQLGYPLVDRKLSNGQAVEAVAGFDATFSAPKSLSVLWALTGDGHLLEAHNVAVAAALAHLERFGSTTRIRSDGRRLHPDTGGLTIAVFRQTTSRADDPQIHTHAVISAKVQTADGRWFALDAHYLKWYQRMLGGLYQSVLRNELTHRSGYNWTPIVNGQAEIAGFPDELRAVFSKRAEEVEAALKVKVDEFRQREGRSPTRFERAAMEREAAVDTRGHKSGLGVAELTTRWQAEAEAVGWTAERLREQVERAAAERLPTSSVSVADVVAAVSGTRSSWHRAAVVQAICDLHRPVSQLTGHQWATMIEQAADAVVGRCVDLDPPGDTVSRRVSDGRSVWIQPTAPRFTSNAVLTQEEHIISWALDAQTEPPAPSKKLERGDLDALQASAAAAVAGKDRLVLVVGPAGAGKTRMLAAAISDLHVQHRRVFGVAPTAKAARVLERDTGMPADTVAKLLHEWQRPDRPPRPEYRLAVGTTLVVDEAGMLSTPALHQLVCLAEAQRWRLVLVGDHRQLQAVGRGGLFAELCADGRVEVLERLHRFTHKWEAAASLKLRSGDPRALDAYQANDRIIPGTLDDHLQRMAEMWIEHHQNGDTVALVASTNDDVDAINQAVQDARAAAGDLDSNHAVRIAGGEHAHVRDVVATRRNDRTRITTAGEPVRNRETWTVTAIGTDGSLTVSREQGHGSVTLPADYVHEHVRLGYAATEHGYQSDTVDHSIALVSTSTTRRGLYVAATRGRDENRLCVVTDSDDVTEARDVLEAILAYDRADIPALTQRRTLAQQHPREATRQLPSTPRCEVPDWFEPLRAELRREMTVAEGEVVAFEARRTRLAAEAAAAEYDLAVVEAQTAPAREALAVAMRRADEARWQRNETERRLAGTGLRGRRAARREVDAAETREDRAVDYRESVRRYAGPHIDQHNQARERVDETRDALYRHDQRARLRHTLDKVLALRYQVGAVDTWGRLARGDTISIQQLGDAVTPLTSVGRWDHHADRFQALGQAIRDWADHAEVDLPAVARQGSSLERAGLDIGL
jgi:conjugative relaxase-like TrwC/TraI family protein